MNEMRLYLKTEEAMQRPTDAAYYLLSRDGLFFCRNHAFFRSDVPARHTPAWLKPHTSACRLNYPKLPISALEYIVGFFRQVYELHASEAIALLYWDMARKRYRIVVPPQTATVWESSTGTRAAMDVNYEIPVPPAGCLLVASIHSHADGNAYSSWTDQHDEAHRDGIHVVCGRIHCDPPEFHLEFAVDKQRFSLEFGHFFRGYERLRRQIPRDWLDKVQCKVLRSQWSRTDSQSYDEGTGGYYESA